MSVQSNQNRDTQKYSVPMETILSEVIIEASDADRAIEKAKETFERAEISFQQDYSTIEVKLGSPMIGVVEPIKDHD